MKTYKTINDVREGDEVRIYSDSTYSDSILCKISFLLRANACYSDMYFEQDELQENINLGFLEVVSQAPRKSATKEHIKVGNVVYIDSIEYHIKEIEHFKASCFRWNDETRLLLEHRFGYYVGVCDYKSFAYKNDKELESLFIEPPLPELVEITNDVCIGLYEGVNSCKRKPSTDTKKEPYKEYPAVSWEDIPKFLKLYNSNIKIRNDKGIEYVVLYEENSGNIPLKSYTVYHTYDYALTFGTLYEKRFNRHYWYLVDCKVESIDKNPKKCVVKGCTNKTNEGNFVGDICAPCHEYMTKHNVSKELIHIEDRMKHLHKLTKEDLEKLYEFCSKDNVPPHIELYYCSGEFVGNVIGYTGGKFVVDSDEIALNHTIDINTYTNCASPRVGYYIKSDTKYYDAIKESKKLTWEELKQLYYDNLGKPILIKNNLGVPYKVLACCIDHFVVSIVHPVLESITYFNLTKEIFLEKTWELCPTSKYFVKSIKGIIETDKEYTLEQLRIDYPNCIYKKSNEETWVE